jgi:hypothetical protein
METMSLKHFKKGFKLYTGLSHIALTVLFSFCFSFAAEAQEWTDQYLFAVSGQCQNHSSMKFSKLDTVATSQVGTNPDGDAILHWVTFGLLKDKTYKASYEEYIPREDSQGQLVKEIVYSKTFSGRWEKSNYGSRQIDLYSEDNKKIIFGLVETQMIVDGKVWVYSFRLPDFGRGKQTAQAAVVYSESPSAAMNETPENFCKSPY